MPLLLPALFILASLALLYLGGEMLVRSAGRLARTLGVSPLVIGLTVVAFGTSTPELGTSLAAALRGSPEIALGNVVGSNTANIALILGVTALLHPLRTRAVFLRREVPIMLACAVLLPLAMIDGVLGRAEAGLLLALLGGYLWLLLRDRGEREVPADFERAYGPIAAGGRRAWRAVPGVVAGLALLVVGAQLLVANAATVARGFGVSELIIGLTLVAVGTSIPELVTSVIAAVGREADIALGNIVGSNIFNILAILGTTGLIRPIVVPWSAVAFDLWVMIGASLLLLPLLATRFRLDRVEGGALLALYGAYVAFLFLR